MRLVELKFQPIRVLLQNEHCINLCTNFVYRRAVVVAQLVERLLHIPEVRGSNPVIGKNLIVY